MAALFGPGCVMSNQCRIAKRGLQVPFLESREPLVIAFIDSFISRDL
jgi:hypothetical protein